jgi:hypothetical protein
MKKVKISDIKQRVATAPSRGGLPYTMAFVFSLARIHPIETTAQLSELITLL